MRKIMMAFMAVALAAFTYINTGVYAEKKSDMGKSDMTRTGQPIDKTKADVKHLIGKDIKNEQGEKLGSVKDFIADPDGRISLAVVSHGGFLGAGGKDVAVPFFSLRYNEDQKYFTMNATKDQLAGAPEFKGDEKMNERNYAEQVYKYFGVRPYWTSEGGAAATHESGSMKTPDSGSMKVPAAPAPMEERK